MIPPARPDLGPEETAAVAEVLASGMIAGGRRVAELEERWAKFCGSKHALAMSNGTVALMSIWAGLGLEPGDEVIVDGASGLHMEVRSRGVSVDGATVSVTPLEWRLLMALMENKGQVLSPDQLLELAGTIRSVSVPSG